MKLSHEKVIQLSHQIASAIDSLDEVEVFDESNNIRQEIVKIILDILKAEENVDAAVRQRITSQKRTIPEGGAEWEILYRKYYADEMRKIGVNVASSSRS